MSRYDDFRQHTSIEKSSLNVRISDFIEKHLSSTKVNREGSEILFSAVLTKTHKEGLEETLLFTYPEENVKVGEYIVNKGITYLVFMLYRTPLSEHYTKNSLIECNVTISLREQKQRGAYKSSLRNFVDTQSENKIGSTFVADIDKPVIITSENKNIKVNSVILAAGDPYKVLNIDRISNEGIMYLSIEPVPHNLLTQDYINQTIKEVKPKTEEKNPERVYKAGIEQIIVTTKGYIKFDKEVEIISRTSNIVKFKIPYGIEEITIETKNENGDVVKTTREVV